jgi:hypothetical protein
MLPVLFMLHETSLANMVLLVLPHVTLARALSTGTHIPLALDPCSQCHTVTTRRTCALVHVLLAGALVV